MQSVSDLYKQIYKGNHSAECKVIIAGTTFTEAQIYSLSTDRNVFGKDTISIGACVSGEIEVEVISPQASIPPMAKIQVYVRIYNETQTSEWIPKGVFYIDTREKNVEKNTLKLHGYDAMLKLEQPVCTYDQSSQWPKMDSVVVADLFSRIGASYDGAFTFDKGYQIPYPGHLDGALYMREVLGYIAAMYAGNFIINDTGHAHFIRLNDLPPETFSLLDTQNRRILFGLFNGSEVGINVNS